MPLKLIASREEAEAVMNEVALNANEQRLLAAERDEKVLAVHREYEAELNRCEAELQAGTEALRLWAESHPGEFARDKKSLQLAAGTLGFRTGTPRLALLSRMWNWDKVTGAVQTLLPRFIRNRPEVNKEGILAERAALEAVLAQVGVRVVQEETFYVEPNLSVTVYRQRIAA